MSKTETAELKLTPTLFDRSKESWSWDLAVAFQVAFRQVRTVHGTGSCFDVGQAKDIILQSLEWVR